MRRSFPSYTARDLRNGKLQTTALGSRPSFPTVEEGCGDKISRLVSKPILACQIKKKKKVELDCERVYYRNDSLGCLIQGSNKCW